MWYIAHYGSPLGDITLASDGDALTGLWFLTSSAFDNKVPGSPSGYDGQKHFDSTIGTQATLHAELQVFDNARRWLDAYFAGHPAGTFHAYHTIWSYSDIRRYCPPHRLSFGAGRWRSHRAQPHLHHHSLPPGDRLGRKPHRLCWRYRPQTRPPTT